MRLVTILFLTFAVPLQAQTVLLHKYLEQCGEVQHYRQSAEDCSACAAAVGVDIVNAVRLAKGQIKEFPGYAAPEPIYWGSRLEIGKDALRNRSGSLAEWAAKWLQEYGVLYKQQYSNGKETFDFTTYDRARVLSRKRTGVPDWLEPIARQNPINVRRMANVKDVIDAIQSGCPVIINSSYAFPRQRDGEGFTVPYLDQEVTGPFGGSRKQKRHTWRHSMVMTGFIDGQRKGIVIQNSSYDNLYQEGPNPYGLPFDSWAVDVEYVDRMVKDYYDCWALGVDSGVEPTWVIVLATEGCEACEKQISVIPDGYRWGKIIMSKEHMANFGLEAIYPTTVIVVGDVNTKTFQGFTPWYTIEPFARKAKQ